jgi:hypothetical protein
MVQLIESRKKLCERDIASNRKCASIGSVQEKFLSVQRKNFIQAPFRFSGQTSSNQGLIQQYVDAKLLLVRLERAVAKGTR